MVKPKEKRWYERPRVTIVEMAHQAQLLQTSSDLEIFLEEEDWDYDI